MPLTFAEVIFPQRLTQSFTYRIPASWHNTLNVGHWVLAPFGRTVRPGFVVAMSQNPPDATFSVDKIRDLEDDFTPRRIIEHFINLQNRDTKQEGWNEDYINRHFAKSLKEKREQEKEETEDHD